MSNTNSIPPMTIKTSPEDRAQILKDAQDAGMALSSYVRMVLLKNSKTRAVYRRNELRQLIKKLIGEIGRTGNNMNQIAWKQNSGQVLVRLDQKLHAEGVQALKDMRAILVHHLQTGPC